MLDQDNSRLTVRDGILPSGFPSCNTGEQQGSPGGSFPVPTPPGGAGTPWGPCSHIHTEDRPILPVASSISCYCSLRPAQSAAFTSVAWHVYLVPTAGIAPGTSGCHKLKWILALKCPSTTPIGHHFSLKVHVSSLLHLQECCSWAQSWSTFPSPWWYLKSFNILQVKQF